MDSPMPGESGQLRLVDKPLSPSLRKSNDAVALRAQKGRLTLLSRKVFNALLKNAQRCGVCGVGDPIGDPDGESQQMFWMRYSELVRDASYNSNDLEVLKNAAEQLMSTILATENPGNWTAIPLLSKAQIITVDGTRWFGYKFDTKLLKDVLTPGLYYPLDFLYTSKLSSNSGLALYEIARRYATSPKHLTMSNPYAWWFSSLTGLPVKESPPPYKYFKRDQLKPAIDEVNALTDVTVVLIEKKNGRRIEELQFEVREKKQQPIDFSGPLIDSTLIARLRTIGLSERDSHDLLGRYDNTLLEPAIDHTERRMRDQNLAKLKSPAAYLKDALSKGYAPTLVAQTKLRSAKSPTLENSPNKPLDENGRSATPDKLAYERYATTPSEERDLLWQEFVLQAPQYMQRHFASGPSKPVARAALSDWLAKRWALKASEDESA